MQTAATNFSRSISLAEVIDSHRTWTTSSGQTKPVGEISLKNESVAMYLEIMDLSKNHEDPEPMPYNEEMQKYITVDFI